MAGSTLVGKKYKIIKRLNDSMAYECTEHGMIGHEEWRNNNVFLGIDIHTGLFVILKQLLNRAGSANRRNGLSDTERLTHEERIYNEVVFSKKMSGKKGFLLFYDCCEQHDGTWIVIQYILGGDMHDFMQCRHEDRTKKWSFYKNDGKTAPLPPMSVAFVPPAIRPLKEKQRRKRKDSEANACTSDYDADADLDDLSTPVEEMTFQIFEEPREEEEEDENMATNSSSSPMLGVTSSGDISRTSSGIETPRDDIEGDGHNAMKLPSERAVIRGLFMQMANCVRVLHKNHIAHRDIKLENFCLDEHGNIYLLDFGLSCAFIPGMAVGSLVGTPYYVPPEIARHEITLPDSVDIWGLGVCLFCMLFSRMPFNGSNISEVYREITNFQTVEGIMTAAEFASVGESEITLLNWMMSPDPEDRPTASQVTSHAWVKKKQSFLPRFTSKELLNQMNEITALGSMVNFSLNEDSSESTETSGDVEEECLQLVPKRRGINPLGRMLYGRLFRKKIK